jgi:hypothetical protein
MAYSRSVDTTTIPNAGTTGDAKTVPNKKTLAGFKIPATFTGTAVSFQGSTDAGGSWADIYDGGSAYSVSVAAGKYHAIKPEVFYGVGLLRIVSNATEGGEREIVFVFID